MTDTISRGFAFASKIMHIQLLALLFVAACASAGPDHPRSHPDGMQIVTPQGVLQGAMDNGTIAFKGIPYAGAPVGKNRWMPPQPAPSWTSIRPATQFGASCPQAERTFAGARGRLAKRHEPPKSEDCLHLNVWTPQVSGSKPVMVWFHGGSHRFGSGAQPYYDGSELAKDGVVLVTVNYRLGLLGYFAHPALTAEVANDAPLSNYGHLDQIAALKWVQQNISKFGGDPKNVTIFGESAGGASVLYLLASENTTGLFHRAIVESGGGTQSVKSLGQKEAEGIKVANMLGLGGASATSAQLRHLTPTQLVRAGNMVASLGFGEVVDGRAIKRTPEQAFATGRAVDVPLIIGSNSNEASLIQSEHASMPSIMPNLTEAQRAEAAAIYGLPEGSKALEEALFGDILFTGAARTIGKLANTGAPAWVYHFDYVPTARRRKATGANHAAEIPFIFDSWHKFPVMSRMMSSQDRAMTKLMKGCWVQFARTGRPDGCTMQPWPNTAESPDTPYVFAINSGPQSGFHAARLDFVERLLSQTAHSDEP